MHADLMGAVDAFDRVIAAADGLVEPKVLDPVARTVRSVRDRAGYLGDTLVAAVAGGTGSGKSSLINAVAGETVTESGGMRPTTGMPLAWIPSNPEPGLMRLLDDLGVDERVGQDLYHWLALLDLPDTDSVVVDHRHTVEALLPRVDMVLWVIDPEKYQDRLLHEQYIKPLAPYHRQFLFVLNQTDRLTSAVKEQLIEDLTSTLTADGIPDPRIVAVAADPDVGPPVGMDELLSLLEETVDVKQVVYDKLATDLSEAAQLLATSPDVAGGVGFAPRWDEACREAAEKLASGDDRGAERVLNGFVELIADEVGGGASETIRRDITPTEVVAALEVAREASGALRTPSPPPPSRWVKWGRWGATAVLVLALIWGVDRIRAGGALVLPAAVVVAAGLVWTAVGAWSSRARSRRHRSMIADHRESLVDPMARQIDGQLGRELRAVLRARSGVTAAATELNLALSELDRRLGRQVGLPATHSDSGR